MRLFLIGAAMAVALPSAAFAQEAPKKECRCCKEMKNKDCCCDKKGSGHGDHEKH